MSKIEISKVQLKVGGKEIELSLEEAQELKKILNETFPEVHRDVVVQPYIVRDLPYPYRPYDVWYRNTSDGVLSLSDDE